MSTMERIRLDRWQAPTGRWLEPGHTFKVRGRRGTFRFVAFVDGDDPHVEAVQTRGPRIVRAFRPEAVHTVSTTPKESR